MRAPSPPLLLLLTIVVSAKLAVAADSASTPELAWQERDDWINVRTEVEPPAKGDGRTDDTAAIQAALNRLQEGVTIYFPPGTYRISKTLTSPDGRFIGVTLLGHGRTTILSWHGDAGGTMFWSNRGMPYTRYVGLTWDGNNKAAVGFEHSSQQIFETEVRHQHELYRNFTEAGIRVGRNTRIATAETLYDNCLFENCKHGISLMSFNVLDHTIDGCEFRNCGVGVSSAKGTNCYVRNTHFAASRETDIVSAGEQGSSVRRCTSQGSAQFLVHRSGVGPLVVQDCHVASWTSADGAMNLSGAPALVFDCSFEKGPADASPIVIGPDAQRLVVSQNSSPDGVPLVRASGAKPIELGAGEQRASLASPRRTFLKSNVAIATKVFDAKRDFGAKGDFHTDDTDAARKTIEAARSHGKGAIAYFPPGRYLISETLQLTGGDYYVGGSGVRSSLVWRGPAGGTTVELREPQGVTIENIGIGFHEPETSNNQCDIRFAGTGKPSSATFDRVWAWGMYQMKPLEHGLHLVNLGPGDRVNIRELNGNIRIIDSADAQILLRLSYEGAIVIEGQSPDRGGFIGGGVRLATHTIPALWIKDNHSLVMSDFYSEQSQQILRMEGDAKQPAGRVTVQGAKFELNKPENNGVEVNNYRGELVIGPYQFYVGNPLHRFAHRGDAPFSLALLGGTFYNSQPEFKLAPSAKLHVAAIYFVGLNDDDTVSAVKGRTDTPLKEAEDQLIRGLDDLRRLGAVDLEMNHPQ